MSWPNSECITSGWNCTPASPRAMSSNAAIGVPSVDARTSKPGGATVTASVWLIQTRCDSGRPRSSTPGSLTCSVVRPNSDRSVCATVPPSASAIAWKP